MDCFLCAICVLGVAAYVSAGFLFVDFVRWFCGDCHVETPSVVILWPVYAAFLAAMFSIYVLVGSLTARVAAFVMAVGGVVVVICLNR